MALPVATDPQPASSSQLKPLTLLAAQQPQTLNDIVSQPAVWIAYTPLALMLLLLLSLLRTSFLTSLTASAVSTGICVLYAAQQRLLLGRQEQIAVLRTRKAVAGNLAGGQHEAASAEKNDGVVSSSQIVLTLLGAEVTDALPSEGTHGVNAWGCSATQYEQGLQASNVAMQPGSGTLHSA